MPLLPLPVKACPTVACDRPANMNRLLQAESPLNSDCLAPVLDRSAPRPARQHRPEASDARPCCRHLPGSGVSPRACQHGEPSMATPPPRRLCQQPPRANECNCMTWLPIVKKSGLNFSQWKHFKQADFCQTTSPVTPRLLHVTPPPASYHRMRHTAVWGLLRRGTRRRVSIVGGRGGKLMPASVQ
jgi:hypothetical protein